MKKLFTPFLILITFTLLSFINGQNIGPKTKNTTGDKIGDTTGDITVAGVNYPRTFKTENTTLLLNGAGIRSKWFIDLYTAGVYILKKSTAANEIINCDCVQAFRIVITSSLVTTDKFNAAIDEALNKSMNNNTSSITKEITQLKTALGTDLKANDEFLLVYHPKEGLKVYKNKEYRDTIKGLNFKKETMKIWLGENCINSDLKEDLLGIE